MASASPELALLRLLAATEASRGARRADIPALAARVDWKAFLALALRHRLLVLAHERLAAAGVEAPDDLVETATLHAAETRRAAVADELRTVRLVAALADGGVAAMPLKGPQLARALYGDTAQRPSVDMDVLVAPGDLARAEHLLRPLGYAPDRRTHIEGGLPLLHVRYLHPQAAALEVHWRVHWYETRFSAEMLATAAPDADGLPRAQPAHELLALLAFYARDGFAGLRWPADIAQWWSRQAGAIGPDGLEPLLARHAALRRPAVTAAHLLERVVGVPAAGLLGRAAATAHVSRAARLADWSLSGSDKQVWEGSGLVDIMLAPPGARSAAVRRHLVLTPDVIRLRWGKDSPPSAPRVALAGAGHLVRVSRRYAVALWRMRRGRYSLAERL
jgi:hypothetical protein